MGTLVYVLLRIELIFELCSFKGPGSYLQATTVLTNVKKIAVGISVSTEALAKEMLTWISISCNPMQRRFFFKAMVKKNPDTFFLQRVKKSFWHLDYVYLSC